MKKLFKNGYGYVAVLLMLPLVSYAQTIPTMLVKIQEIITTVVPILIGIAVLYFLYGVLKYVVAKDPEAQKEARSVMIYGIIVLFVMVSIWGLVNVLANTFDVEAGRGPGGTGSLVPTN